MSSIPVSTSTNADPAHPATNMTSRIFISRTLTLITTLWYPIEAEFGARLVEAGLRLKFGLLF